MNRVLRKFWTGNRLRKLTLIDGTPIRLRTLKRSDKRKLNAGFNRLSDRSRYQRFLHDKQALSPSELDFLTTIDGEHHIAIAIIGKGLLGFEGRGLAVGRMIRLENDPTAAELAITVADEFHGRGLGRLLLASLARQAIEKGIKRLQFNTLGTNRAMRKLLDRTGWELSSRICDGAVTVEAILAPSDYLNTAIQTAERLNRKN